MKLINNTYIEHIYLLIRILANLCLTQQGVVLLEKDYSSDIKESFEDYSSYLRNLPSELKNRAFSSLEMVFQFDEKVSAEVWCVVSLFLNITSIKMEC